MKTAYLLFGGLATAGVLLYLARDKQAAASVAPGAQPAKTAAPAQPAGIPGLPNLPPGGLGQVLPGLAQALPGLIPPNIQLPTQFPTLADIPAQFQQVLQSPEAQNILANLQGQQPSWFPKFS